MCQPYTYLIRFIPTGELYYGVRWAKGCHPDDLWVRYFTTSKVVKQIIKEYGKDYFEIVHIKHHPSKEAALKWEELYLMSVNAGYNENYLNKTNGNKKWCVTEESILKNTGENHWNYGKHQSEELNRNQSERMSGENHWNWGGHHSEETKQKMSEVRIGKYRGEDSPAWGISRSEETRIKISENHADVSGENNPFYGKHHTEETKQKLREISAGENNPNAKKYIITFPDGHEELIYCLVEFCRTNNLVPQNMGVVAKGKCKQHKGFKCRYATEEEIILYK